MFWFNNVPAEFRSYSGFRTGFRIFGGGSGIRMVQLRCGGTTANGKRIVWKPQGKIGRHPMSKQTVTVWLCETHTQTHGIMLKRSEKLLRLDSPHSSSIVFMPTRSPQNSGAKYGVDDSWDATPRVIHIWQFKCLPRVSTMDRADCGYWPGQRRRTPHMGSSKHTIVPDPNPGRVSSTHYMRNITSTEQLGRFWFCQQHRSLYHRPQWRWRACGWTNAILNHSVGGPASSNRRHTSPRKMFLVLHPQHLEQREMAICWHEINTRHARSRWEFPTYHDSTATSFGSTPNPWSTTGTRW